MKKLLSLSLALTLAGLSGCTLPPKVDWASRVGTYTFDTSVKELGPPEKSATLSDATRVAEWLAVRGTSTASYHSFPDGHVSRTEGVRGPDQWLQLTFSPDGKLTAWKRVWR